MKKIKSLLLLSTLVSLIAVGFSSCVKKDYDEPVTANLDPVGVAATHTIAQLQTKAIANIPTLIDEDIIISGVIIADDESGSFYKEMIIQDSTAGLSIQLDVSNYNTNYPIGRRIFVKCKGLYIAKDADLNYSIGLKDAATIARIPQTLYEQYIIKGKWGVPVTPTKISLTNVNNVKTNTLIQLDSVEFQPSDAGKTYANAATLTYKNTVILDCSGNSVIVYTSGYAKFANEKTPVNNGTLLSVYKLYRGAPELIMRNAEDAIMTNPNRCFPIPVYTLMPIDSLRMVYTGSITSVPTGRKIRGVVISDVSTSHITSKNVVIQDNTGGILVRFSANNSFFIGEEIEIEVGGQELSEYNGLLQVNNVPNGNAVSLGTASITPAVVTIQDILNNPESFESTLVTIQNATISGSGTTYSGSKTLTDATNSLTLFTSSAATFSATTFPTTPVSLTGIVSQFTSSLPPSGGYQIGIRSLSDVQ